jgi:hypothetical protein
LKIYAASSWKNLHQPDVVKHLRQDGHSVYDFRTEAAFSWKCIDENWKDWTIEQYMGALERPESLAGFNSDFRGVKWCDAGVLILPCGLSAGIEAGFIKGSGKPIAVYVPEMREPELMVKCFDFISTNLFEVREFLARL